jgi:hypothetical protein
MQSQIPAGLCLEGIELVLLVLCAKGHGSARAVYRIVGLSLVSP